MPYENPFGNLAQPKSFDYDPNLGKTNLIYGGGAQDPNAGLMSQCTASGGTWDPIANVCIPRESSNEPTPQPTSFDGTSTDSFGNNVPYNVVDPTTARPAGYTDNTPAGLPEVRQYPNSSPMVNGSVGGGRGTYVPAADGTADRAAANKAARDKALDIIQVLLPQVKTIRKVWEKIQGDPAIPPEVKEAVQQEVVKEETTTSATTDGEPVKYNGVVQMIGAEEGMSNTAYEDPPGSGKWAIGYGQQTNPVTGKPTKQGDTITDAQAQAGLKSEVESRAGYVNNFASKNGYNWTQNQLDALTSFSYNVGSLDQLTANGSRTNAEILAKIIEYNKAGGKVLPGLTKRRQKEADLFDTKKSGGNDSGSSVESVMEAARNSQADKVAASEGNTPGGSRTTSSGNETYESKVRRGGGYNTGGTVYQNQIGNNPPGGLIQRRNQGGSITSTAQNLLQLAQQAGQQLGTAQQTITGAGGGSGGGMAGSMPSISTPAKPIPGVSPLMPGTGSSPVVPSAASTPSYGMMGAMLPANGGISNMMADTPATNGSPGANPMAASQSATSTPSYGMMEAMIPANGGTGNMMAATQSATSTPGVNPMAAAQSATSTPGAEAPGQFGASANNAAVANQANQFNASAANTASQFGAAAAEAAAAAQAAGEFGTKPPVHYGPQPPFSGFEGLGGFGGLDGNNVVPQPQPIPGGSKGRFGDLAVPIDFRYNPPSERQPYDPRLVNYPYNPVNDKGPFKAELTNSLGEVSPINYPYNPGNEFNPGKGFNPGIGGFNPGIGGFNPGNIKGPALNPGDRATFPYPRPSPVTSRPTQYPAGLLDAVNSAASPIRALTDNGAPSRPTRPTRPTRRTGPARYNGKLKTSGTQPSTEPALYNGQPKTSGTQPWTESAFYNGLPNGIQRNSGGSIPNYNDGGGLANHPYDREGEQFDQVPAMLTEGEFVVDADSAHKFGDQLEQMNNWEPDGSTQAATPAPEEAPMEEEFTEDNKLERKEVKQELNDLYKTYKMMAEDDFVDATEKAELKKKVNELMQRLNKGGRVKVQNKNLGGFLSSAGSLFGGDPQRDAAANARNAEVQGAAVNAGVQGLGRAQDSISANIGSIGLETNSLGGWGSGGYNPASFSQQPGATSDASGVAQAVGQGQQEIANAEAGYQSELSSIAGAEAAEATRIGERDEDISLEQERLDAEEKAKQGKLDEKDKELLRSFQTSGRKTVESLILLPKTEKYLTARNAIVRNAFGSLSRAEQAAYLAAVTAGSADGAETLLGKKTEVSLYDLKQADRAGSQAFATLQANIQAMTAGALDTLGPGPKTDFDFKVVAQSIADLEGEPWEIKATLENFLRNVNAEIVELGGQALSSPTGGKPIAKPYTTTEGTPTGGRGSYTGPGAPAESPTTTTTWRDKARDILGG